MQFEKGEAHAGAERCEGGDRCFTSHITVYLYVMSQTLHRPPKVINFILNQTSNNNGLHVIKNPFKNVNVYDTRL